MKKIISAILVALYAVTCLAGCGTNSSAAGDASGKISVVATIFPEYDWVKNIAWDIDNIDVTMLLDNGVDLHSYQPTAVDIAKISDCDMFIYVGGESDEWVEDALSEAKNKDMVVINLLETLGDSVKAEEVKEGMEAEEEHDHDHEEGEDHDHEEGEDHDHEHEEGEIEFDEHVWLSLKNTAVICDAIEAGLEKIDAANAELYRANLDSYKAELDKLDKQYEEVTSAAEVKTVLFGDRFPFRYLVDDYGLDYYAAFVGCSAETEASFETIVFLANKVDELGLKHVMKIEGTKTEIADTIINNTNGKDMDVLTLDSMQSTTSKDAKEGATYLGIMMSNLEVLKKALN